VLISDFDLTKARSQVKIGAGGQFNPWIKVQANRDGRFGDQVFQADNVFHGAITLFFNFYGKDV
jgi:hypothetical protein